MKGFTAEDIDIIVGLAQGLTGNVVDRLRHGVIAQNVMARVATLKLGDFESYLRYVNKNDQELAHLISALTIHTTTWFREPSTCEKFEEIASDFAAANRNEPFRVLSAGCSTGEELYSYGLILESLRSRYPKFEYSLEGWDIDEQCLRVARRGIYTVQGFESIPPRYRNLISVRDSQPFRVPQPVVQRSHWQAKNLTKIGHDTARFDFISCRNVLIYFSSKQVHQVVNDLTDQLLPKGYLSVGVSEASSVLSPRLQSMGRATFQLVGATTKVKFMNGAGTANSGSSKIRPEVIALGASTGGTEELAHLLKAMPDRGPPILVVQHISPMFAPDFAKRLADVSGLRLGRMQAGEELQRGCIYVALGDYHVGVRRVGNILRLQISDDPPLNRHRPSVDYLFFSLAKARLRTFAALLTGMGRDGAEGLLALRKIGAITWAQDESSSAVFGMPKEAIMLDAAMHIGTPSQIREHINQIINSQSLLKTA